MTLIYYFSGSGNSLAVAKDIADDLAAKLVPMASHRERLGLPDETDAVGFVFPSHDFQAPAFVQEWMTRLEGLAGKYVFAVMTYGISAGKGLKKFKALVAKRGGSLAFGFAVMMPHNGIGSRLQPPEVRERLIQQWRDLRSEVVNAIATRATAELESEFFVLGFLRDGSWKMLPGLFRFLGLMMREGKRGLYYNADDRCNGCGICARVCPVANIELKDGRPIWKDACINCFACLHWCPREATHLSARDLKIDHAYLHPDVTVKDMTG